MVTAVCDLDKNTAGGTTKEVHVSHTHIHAHRNKQDVNMLSLAGGSPDTMQTTLNIQC